MRCVRTKKPVKRPIASGRDLNHLTRLMKSYMIPGPLFQDRQIYSLMARLYTETEIEWAKRKVEDDPFQQLG